MDALPPELLSQIFSLLLPIPPCDLKPEASAWKTRPATLTRLRLVSRDWNQVILATPELWTYIEINSQTAGVDPYISRSGNSLLHIRITVDARAILLPSFQQSLEMVFSCTERWKTYSLQDVRHPAGVSSNLTDIIPSQPLPALQVASLVMPFKSDSGTVLNAPVLNRLNTWTVQNFQLVESPFLKYWSIHKLPFETNWTGIIRNLIACPKLEKLSVVGTKGIDSTFPEETIPTSITMPALKELELNDEPTNHQLLARLEPPQLQTLIFNYYRSRVPFTLPQSTSSLVTIRFTNRPRINAIRRAVAALPLIQELTVEIDAWSACLPGNETRTAFEHLKSDRSWLERHARIKWIGQESVPSHLFQTWEEAHGLVPL